MSLLMYEEENKSFQYFLNAYKKELLRCCQHEDREKFCGFKYPDEILSDNIDEMIADLSNERISQYEEERYKIVFTDKIWQSTKR